VIALLPDELARVVRGRVRRDVPLAGYTTYRIGGPAAVLVEPADADDVARALQAVRAAGSAWLALGLGSNLLVSDDGFPGVVIRVGHGLDEVTTDGPAWRVGAGLPTPILARRSADAGFGGVHRLVGVPGTVGGGVFMNAGAHGQEFRNVVRRVRLALADGRIEERGTADIPWRYRSAGLADVIVLDAELALEPADPRRLRAEITAHFEWRKAGTPFSEPCCGSVFRNPAASGRTAGQLIDAAGMKGFRIGGAQVSPLHANYIVNAGGATAADVLRVIEAVRQRVRREAGVELELEVKLVGLGG
jgi:UDP-N-acetylmuramate dehydrogenase